MNEDKNGLTDVKMLYDIAKKTLSLLEEKQELLPDEKLDGQNLSPVQKQAAQSLILELDKKVQHLDEAFVKAYEIFSKQRNTKELTEKQNEILKKLQQTVVSICTLRQMNTAASVYKRKRTGMK